MFDLLKTKGALANFYMGIGNAAPIYPNYCTIVPATTKTETLAWPGQLPIPAEMQGERKWQHMTDYSVSLTNLTYEMSTVIPREALEDDQTGLLNQRMQDFGRAWETFKDSQFCTLLSNGDVAGNTAFDGTLFFTSTRTIGKSANIDNTQATNVTVTTQITSTECLNLVQDAMATMGVFQDDQGRAGFATQAMTQLRVLGAPGQARAFQEATTSAFISQSDNPWGRSLFQWDISPYAVTDEVYICAVGETRKPFIYSERTPLEVIMQGSNDQIAEHDGLRVLSRQRYLLTYGDPRLIIQDNMT